MSFRFSKFTNKFLVRIDVASHEGIQKPVIKEPETETRNKNNQITRKNIIRLLEKPVMKSDTSVNSMWKFFDVLAEKTLPLR